MRKTILLMDDWFFTYRTDEKININLPHTWNNLDGQDGGGDYFKGTCWYYKKLGKLPLEADEVAYLEF